MTHSKEALKEYGKKSKTDAGKVLRSLQCQIQPEEDQWLDGRLIRVCPEKILLDYLFQLEKEWFDKGRLPLAGTKVEKRLLRSVRLHHKTSSASCGSGLDEQHRTERSDALQVLSRLLARHAEKAWITYRGPNAFAALDWESGIARVKAGVKARGARLKALGNAVHPDIPMMIGHAILQAEASQ